MNYSTAVMLINPHIRAIKTIYEPDTDSKKQTRTTFKTLDHSIKVGDFVVIPTNTRHSMTVVKVAEVDVEVDYESDLQINWVTAKFSALESEKIQTEEKKWIEALKASEKLSKQNDIKDKMMAMYKDAGIEKMPIANFTDITAIEYKPAEE